MPTIKEKYFVGVFPSAHLHRYPLIFANIRTKFLTADTLISPYNHAAVIA